MKRLAMIAAAAAALGFAAPAHALTPVSAGHLDVLDVDLVGTSLTLDIRDARTAVVDDDLDPATVELHALPASRTTVPAGATWSFLGSAGSSVWILPQTQNAALLWPGWNTEDTAGAVTLKLESVSGPGRFVLYTTGAFGAPSVKFNSADGLPDTFAVAGGTHAHGNWAFGAAGTYTLTFRALASGRDSGTRTYTVVVEP
jgi:surface-anchored protein